MEETKWVRGRKDKKNEKRMEAGGREKWKGIKKTDTEKGKLKEKKQEEIAVEGKNDNK